VVTIRPFNTYGPRQSARAVIPTVITQIASGRKAINLGALTPTRDFTYVDDTVRGFLAVIEAEKVIGKVINLGTGQELAIGDLVARIAQLMNTRVTVNTDQQRVRPEPSEVVRLVCDNRRAKELLRWEPSCSLTEGLARSIEWFTDNRNLQLYKTDRYLI
jgi:nucleoside-diphosphate-sugar epimerase